MDLSQFAKLGKLIAPALGAIIFTFCDPLHSPLSFICFDTLLLIPRLVPRAPVWSQAPPPHDDLCCIGDNPNLNDVPLLLLLLLLGTFVIFSVPWL